MRSRLLVLGTLLLATSLAAGAVELRPDQEPGTAAAVQAGAKVFADTCKSCHGENGEGKAAWAPRLNDQRFLSVASNAFLEATVGMGRPGSNMMAWDKEATHTSVGLSSEQVDQVVAYLRSWQTVPGLTLDETPLKGDAQKGEQIYASDCQQCHGPRGSGVADAKATIGIGHKTYLAAATDGYLRAVWGRCADTRKLEKMAPLPETPDYPLDYSLADRDAVLTWLRQNAW